MIKGKDYPEWLTEQGLATLKQQHLLPNETPFEAYNRVVNSVAGFHKLDLIDNMHNSKLSLDEIENIVNDLKAKWFKYIWNGWLCLSTPVIANCGTTRGLPISCNIIDVDDSIDSIFSKIHEMAALSKYGAGVGVCFDSIRPAGSPIASGGVSEGVCPYIVAYGAASRAVNQGNVRRGYIVANLNASHGDIEDFTKLRYTSGAKYMCRDLQLAVSFSKEDMDKIMNNDAEMRKKWSSVISARVTTGSPYIHFRGNAEAQMPDCFKKRGLPIKSSNLCAEIALPHTPTETVTCMLSSGNVYKYDEWSLEEDFIPNCLTFLDATDSEYIAKASHINGFENAVRFTQKSRALGLGFLGLHSYLQSKMIPFTSIQAKSFYRILGKTFEKGKLKYEEQAIKRLPIPEWCDNTRNATHFAIAPTLTSSIIGGCLSQGIEPIIGNIVIQKTKTGSFEKRNLIFEKYLIDNYPDKNTDEFWNELKIMNGSIQSFDFFTKEEKEVFLTATEINQLELVRQAGIMQQYIDQGMSVNLFFPALDRDKDKETFKFLNQVHIEAYKCGLKSLYYLISEKESSNILSNTFKQCLSCEG